MNDFEILKQSILSEVQQSSDRALLEQIELSGSSKDVVVHCPSLFSQEYIAKRYSGLIDSYVNIHFGDGTSVSYGLQQEIKPVAAPVRSSKPVQMILPRGEQNFTTQLNNSYTFDEFVVGKCNAFAFEAAKAVAEESFAINKPLYFYSDIGLGKSHIAHAIGNQVVNMSSGRRLRYTTAGEFSTDYVHAVMNNSLSSFKKSFTSSQTDILFIDDVHLLKKKEKTQMELCSILDDLMSAGKQVILSGYRPPTSIAQIDKGLQSRFASGLVIDIKHPDRKTRADIIRHKAARNGAYIPEDVVDYICDNVHSSVREIESAVLSITAMSSLMRREITKDLAIELLEGQLKKKQQIDLDFIQKFVAKNFDITPEMLVSPSRKKVIAYPRQIAIYLSRRYTSESLQSIGQAYGRKHTSIMHSLEVIDNKYNQNLKTKKEIDFLIEKLESEL